MDQAESILDQLLKFTAQLAEFENDPQVDTKALSNACIRRLDDLKQLMPQQRENSRAAASSAVLEKMRDLYTRTQVCLEILERKNNRVAAKLQSLSRTKQAISAYNTRRDRNRSIGGQINRRLNRLFGASAQIRFYPLTDSPMLLPVRPPGEKPV